MKQILVFLAILVLSSLACEIQQITPTPYPTIVPTITKIPPTPTICPTIVQEFPTPKTAIVVNTDVGLNIRKEPNDNSTIITTILPNECVTILESYEPINNWVMINWNYNGNNFSGWVNSDYLQIDD